MSTATQNLRPLTTRQHQILDLIKSSIASNGAPPTRAEIATACGFKSANAAEEHLQALERKGVIQLVRSTSRGIRVTEPTAQELKDFVVEADGILVAGKLIDWGLIDTARKTAMSSGYPFRVKLN